EAGPDLYVIMERACGYYRDQLKTSTRAIEYLKGRGLTGKIAARFGVGYAPDGWQNLEGVFPDYAGVALKDAGLVIDAEGGRRYDRFRDRVMFPILNQRGSVIAFGGRVIGDGEPKYLNSPETPLFEKGRELYGLSQARHAIRNAGRVIVVEGYMDVVALAQHGIEYAVATLGTATSPVHVQKLLRQTDEVVFCFDGDAAGRKAAWHALEVSLPYLADNKAVRFLFLPPEHDPDSFVREQGSKALEQKLREAKPLSEFLLDELKGKVNPDTAEGRSRLVHEAKPLLQQLSAPALRLQILKTLAEAAQMSQEDAGRIMEIRIARGYDAKPALAMGAPRGRQLPHRRREDQLLQCLLAKPMLAGNLPQAMLDPDSFDGRALMAVAEYCRRNPQAQGGELIEHFKDGEFAAAIAAGQAALLEIKLDPDNMEVDFHGLVALWQEERSRQKLAVLTAKPDPTAAEQVEIRNLLTQITELKNRNDSGRKDAII
ncbi:MAG TPA: DNA primase, partial [Burkholderiales bacterium]|nr:DNA primase [Burkholderiales bacterium]